MFTIIGSLLMYRSIAGKRVSKNAPLACVPKCLNGSNKIARVSMEIVGAGLERVRWSHAILNLSVSAVHA